MHHLNKIYHIFAERIELLGRFRGRFSWAVFSLLSVNVFLFSYINAIPYVKSDGWRFIEIYLSPWNQGLLNVADLFRDHHPQPLTAVLFIANAEWFGLRMDYEALLGVVFVILGSFVLLREMIKDDIGWLGLVSTAFITLSLVSVNVYTWSLVTIGYIQGLISLLLIAYINQLSRKKIKIPGLLTAIALFCLFLLIFGDGAKIVAIATIGVLIVGAVLERKTDYVKLISAIFVSLFLNSIFYDALGVSNSYIGGLSSKELSIDFNNVVEFAKYIGIGLMSAWGNIAGLKRLLGLGSGEIEVLGLFVLFVYVATAFIYYYSGLYKKTKFPMILIAITALSVVGGLLFRYNPDLHDPISANVPRYYRFYSYGLVGVVWIWMEYINQCGKKVRIFLVSMIVILIGSHLASAINSWDHSKYVKKSISDVIGIMALHGEGDFRKPVPRFVTGGNFPEPYMRGIKFLKENKLNVFMDNSISRKYNLTK